MATVRMSQRLQDEIHRKAKDKFDNTNPQQKIDSKYGDQVADTYIKPHLEKLASVFESDLAHISQSNVYTSVDHLSIYAREDFDTLGSRSENFPIWLSSPIQVPKVLLAYTYDSYIALEVPNTDPAFIEAARIAEYNDKLADRRADFLTNIADTLREFSTLNQALKAFPSLADLVEEAHIQKVHEKVERKKADKQRAEMAQANLADLNEVLLADKLLED